MAKQPSIATAIVNARVAAIDPEKRMKLLNKEIKALERRMGVGATWEYLRSDSLRMNVALDAEFGGAPPKHWEESQESSARVWSALGDMVIKDADATYRELQELRAEKAKLKAALAAGTAPAGP
jgi:hypothetical protein